MKKVLSLIAAVLTSATMFAQLSVTIDGTPIKDGENVVKYYESDKREMFEGSGDYGLWDYGIRPEIFVTSSTTGNLTAKLTMIENAEDVGICFGGACTMADASNNYTATKVGAYTANRPVDLQIEVQHDESTISDKYSRKFKLELSLGSETFSCTFNIGVGEAPKEEGDDPKPDDHIKGDVNHDGVVSIDDITRLIEIYLRK